MQRSEMHGTGSVNSKIEYINDHLELCMVIINPVSRSYFGKISH